MQTLWKLNSQICVYLYAYPESMSASHVSLQKISQTSIAYDVDCEFLNIARVTVCWAAVLGTYRHTLHIALICSIMVGHY